MTNEEQKQEETQPEEKKENEDSSPLEEANKTLEALKKEREALTTERKRIEKAAADMKMQGKSFAGSSQPQKTKEQELKEKALEFWKGTEVAEAIKRHG